MRDLFILPGKLSRGGYAKAVFLKLLLPALVLYIVIFVILSLYFWDALATQHIPSPRLTLFSIYSLLITWIFALTILFSWTILAIKRLRDAGKNWAYSILLYVPIVGIIFFVYLLSAKSKDLGTNNSIENANNWSIPGGFLIVLIFLALSVLWLLISLFYNFWGVGSIVQIGPYIAEWMIAKTIIVIELTLLSSVFIGIIKRKTWAYPLYFWSLVVSLILIIINSALILSNPDILDIIFQKSTIESFRTTRESIIPGMIFSSISGVLFNLAILWYIHKNQKFFKNS